MCVHMSVCVPVEKIKGRFSVAGVIPKFGGEFDLARDVTIIFISECTPLHPHLHTVEIVSEIENPKLTQKEKKSDWEREKIISLSFGQIKTNGKQI